MKNYILLILTSITFFIGCQQEKAIVTFSGKIENYKKDSIIVFHPKIEYRKVIHLQKDGSFKDTLKVQNGLFSYSDGREFTSLYLENGDALTMNYDANKFYETLYFEGNHAIENDFLATSLKKENELLIDTKLMRSTKKDFDSVINNYVSEFHTRLNETELDPSFKAFETKEIQDFKTYITNGYVKTNYAKLVLGKGKPSPKFSNYENFNGGNTSLEDLKGKYIYIDVWATWCKPCTNEIPFLQKLEKEYHNKNISFVSISVDDKRDHINWKNMISDKKMSGIQLFSKGDASFTNAYRITSIPRFILIDPNGNIVDAKAPRPSNPNIKKLFKSLNL